MQRWGSCYEYRRAVRRRAIRTHALAVGDGLFGVQRDCALFRSKFLVDTIALTKCEGLPFYAEEIYAKLKEVSTGQKAPAQPALAQ